MIDQSFGGRSELLRSPDLRLCDVMTELIGAGGGFERTLAAPGRSIFVFVLEGAFEFEWADGQGDARSATAGAAIGVEDGRALVWRLREGTGRLFVSSIPRRIAVLQRLTGGIIVVPPDAEPFARTMKLAVQLHLTQLERLDEVANDPVVNRCAEICLLQFIAFARAGHSAGYPIAGAIVHDERLLAAWTAYFADPRRRWTVKALADAAGLSRTAFAQRFRVAFGEPPLHALTSLRLEQAEAMLRDRNAPLIEIAFTVGYNSEAAFVRAFHRHHGITPGRYRARELANGA